MALEQPFRENEDEHNRARKLNQLVEDVTAANLTSAELVALLLGLGAHTAGQVLTVNAGNNGLEWKTPT
jgi:hypothetical protein